MVRSMLLFVFCTLSTLGVPALAEEPTPPPPLVFSKTGDPIYQTAVKLQKPKGSEDRIAGGKYHAQLALWLPENVKAIRGIYLAPFNPETVEKEQNRAICRHWQFAIVGTNLMRISKDEYRSIMTNGLKELAAQSQHPEVEHAPMVVASMSAGAGMTVSLAELMPERMIACGPVALEVGPQTERAKEVPMMTIFGERDGGQMQKLEALLPKQREAFDAAWAIAPQWRRKHEWGQSNNLLWPFFDEVIQQRLPQQTNLQTQPVELKPCAADQSWYAALAAYHDRPAAITPAVQFKGDRAAACWFPGPRTAAVWQAFVVKEPKLKITQPLSQGDGNPLAVFKAGEPIEIKVECSIKDKPRAAAIYDASEKLQAFDIAGNTASVTLKQLPAGLHTLIACANFDEGEELSRPVTILITPK
jgi:hypothetical protein